MFQSRISTRVRPHPLQIGSPLAVVQIPMQGDSSRLNDRPLLFITSLIISEGLDLRKPFKGPLRGKDPHLRVFFYDGTPPADAVSGIAAPRTGYFSVLGPDSVCALASSWNFWIVLGSFSYNDCGKLLSLMFPYYCYAVTG